MSRRAYPWPPEYPTVDAVMAKVPFLQARIARAGVPTQDRDDILQEVLLGAFSAARDNRYCPDPRIDRDEMLRRWLGAITFHTVSHYRKRAHRRHEEPSPAPERPDVATPDKRADAWRILRALAALRPELREVLRLHAEGWEIQEIAVHMAVGRTTAAKRIRAARKRLARLTREGGR